ncbi:MAG: DegV family protein [Agarilytica sp.]
MSKRIAVITDSSCSLPSKIIDKYNIQQVPLLISIDGKTISDPCKQDKNLAIFQSGRLSKKHDVSTAPPRPEDFEAAIVRAIKSGHKMIVVQTVNRTQGDTYNNANVAASSVRRKLGDRHRDITIRVMDSRTVFAGQGLMVAETIRRILKGQDPQEVRREMDVLSSNIHTFILPRKPLLALERSQKRNETSVGWAQVFIADTLGIHPILCNRNDSSYLAAKSFGFRKAAKQLFEHASIQIESGLQFPMLVLNYAGPLEELAQLPGYQELKSTAEAHKVKMMTSVMSLAGGIYTSVGSISLAMACEPNKWLEKAA